MPSPGLDVRFMHIPCGSRALVDIVVRFKGTPSAVHVEERAVHGVEHLKPPIGSRRFRRVQLSLRSFQLMLLRLQLSFFLFLTIFLRAQTYAGIASNIAVGSDCVEPRVSVDLSDALQ